MKSGFITSLVIAVFLGFAIEYLDLIQLQTRFSFFNFGIISTGLFFVFVFLCFLKDLLKQIWQAHFLTQKEKDEIRQIKYWQEHLSQYITLEEYLKFVQENKTVSIFKGLG